MKVGFVGLGNIGRPMAKHLARGGHDLTVFDIHRDAAEELLAMGASWSDGPAGVARSSEVVLTSLPGPRDVEEALLGEGGILSGAGIGKTVFDLSTIDPESVRRIAGAAAAKGIVFMDAPVSGGVKGAEEATLCVMVGGDRAAYDRFKPVLDLIGDKAMYCGENGSGAVCKIVNNLDRTQPVRAGAGGSDPGRESRRGLGDPLQGGLDEHRGHADDADLSRKPLRGRLRARIPAGTWPPRTWAWRLTWAVG